MFRSVNLNRSNPASELPKLVDRILSSNNIEIVPFTYKVRRIKMAVALKGPFHLKLFSKFLAQSIIIQITVKLKYVPYLLYLLKKD
jgi:hypothetical protein